ncbi:hypothetical protein WK90_36040 [Burkholderia cepacia]|uniref:DUF4123 domain-containing protein n=1 Tax=Burkholderia cepacia TaxID=292 RepID=UPI00075DB556|nr:DUF4123 domain-containing protein [Burkholderia cepacia]KVV58948.1 hypothetical protein WK83_15055 [Burkholderia cepacia]KVV66943.1 hypothetical protein WK84_23200 [Burkholderia cepacia]KVV73912.1 hypothetical protein WK85_13060 [Burkholderia cepacia]KVV78635.1 hypothetical protein WK87_30480 [Burkholderia cepacia]KVV79059.1 hypothetical protein WK88_36385 [Burkholderia cepacia]
MTNDLIAAQAADALQAALSSQDGLRAYVLIDGALLDTLPDDEKASWPAFVAASLLDDAADDEARIVGPLLFEWQPGADGADAANAIEPRSIPWPAASVLVSPLSLERLAAHLAPMVDVQLEQMESVMLMRFFDPRVLPFWLDMLPAAHRAYLAQGVRHWIHRDTSLQLRTADIAAPADVRQAAEFPLQLTQAQEDDLLAACYPYTMLERLRTEKPALLASLPPAQHYGFVRDQLARCRAHGADSAASLLIYCELALRYGARFDEDPAMAAVFDAVAQGQAFPEALALVPAEDWRRMQEAAA